MDWSQVLITIFGNLAWILPLFFWVRSESRADIRHMQAQLDSIRDLTYAIREEGRVFRMQWMEESKDFHNRLCSIEERRK